MTPTGPLCVRDTQLVLCGDRELVTMKHLAQLSSCLSVELCFSILSLADCRDLQNAFACCKPELTSPYYGV